MLFLCRYKRSLLLNFKRFLFTQWYIRQVEGSSSAFSCWRPAWCNTVVSDDWQPLYCVNVIHWWQSSDTITCVVSWTKTHLCDTSFTVVSPRVCNMLSALFHLLVNYTHFYHLLKACLFDWIGNHRDLWPSITLNCPHRHSQGVQMHPPGRRKKFFLGIFCWNEAKMNRILGGAPPQTR